MIQTIAAIFIRDHDSTIQLLREINRLTWKNGTEQGGVFDTQCKSVFSIR